MESRNRSPQRNVRLRRLFARYMRRLAEIRCPRDIIITLKLQEFGVITRVNDVGIDEKNIPFLPVIPQGYRSFHDQMNTVFSGGYRGESRITPHLVVDLEETPADPYFIFDVDVGTSLRGKPPNVARRIIEGRGRLSLTGVEAIAIPLFATSMPECFLHATGSYYCSRAKVLTVHWFKTCADLGWTLGKDRHPEWGTPSCAARF